MASCTSRTLPFGPTRTALPSFVTRSLLPLGAGPPLIGVGLAAFLECELAAVDPRTFCRDRSDTGAVVPVVVVMGRVPGVVVVTGRAPPGFPAGLAAGCGAGRGAGAACLGGGGGGAGFLSVAAPAMLPNPRNTARIVAVETFLMVLLRIVIVIVSSFLSQSLGLRHVPAARMYYSTLLTFPFVKVTFISL
ncbi:MAG: hypothetical protein ABSC48_08380 [Terracidiphilus sp.]